MMECRPLEMTLVSANDIKDVNIFSKMDVYAVVSISGDPRAKKQKTKTPVHKDGGTNPKWNYSFKFTLDDAALLQNRLTLKIKLVSERTLGNTKIGKALIPLNELLQNANDEKQEKHVSYGLRTETGKPKGTVNFAYKFGPKFTVSAPPPEAHKKAHEPVMAYPAQAGHYPGSSSAYPPPPPAHGAAYPAYPYPPTGGYPPQPQPGYGYAPPPQAGYGYPPQAGYGYPPQVVKPQKPKRGGGANMGLGLGAGLLGGLLIGDMVSDVGEMGSYDSGFDGGFGDGFDF